MPLLTPILGILAGCVFVVFNELMTRSALWLNQALFGVSYSDRDVRRYELLFMASGTLLLVMNAVRLAVALRGA